MYFIPNLHKIIIVGNSGAGKTTLARKIINSVDRDKLLIVDANHEFGNYGFSTDTLKYWGAYKRNILHPARYNAKYLDDVIIHARRYYNRLVVIDDLDLFADGSGRLTSEELTKFVINARHQNLGLILIVKRLSGIAYKIIQQMNHIALFTVNSLDVHYLENISPSLGVESNSIVHLTQIGHNSFALFSARSIKQKKDACDPKEFIGFYRNH